MTRWNKMYDMFLKVKKSYIESGGDPNKPFEEWVKHLDDNVFNGIFSIIQINEHQNRVLFRYGIDAMKPAFWNEADSLYRFARSTVIDKMTNELLLSPFQKFFNLNEIEETETHNVSNRIKYGHSFGIMDKLDGSMISARYTQNQIIMSGSQGLDIKKSYRLGIAYDLLTCNQKAMLMENPNYTFVFELIHPEDLHLVDYSEKDQGLYLLGYVDMWDGREATVQDVIDLEKRYGVLISQPENLEFEELLSLKSKFKSNQKEGWVINIDGYKVKLKCDDYVELHRTFDLKGLENIVLKKLAENTFDDFISAIPKHYKLKAETLANEIILITKRVEDEVLKYTKFLESSSTDKTTFMVLKDTVVPKELRGYVVNCYLGKGVDVLKLQHRIRKYNELKSLYELIESGDSNLLKPCF